jgi:hypothetical protein
MKTSRKNALLKRIDDTITANVEHAIVAIERDRFDMATIFDAEISKLRRLRTEIERLPEEPDEPATLADGVASPQAPASP